MTDIISVHVLLYTKMKITYHLNTDENDRISVYFVMIIITIITSSNCSNRFILFAYFRQTLKDECQEISNGLQTKLYKSSIHA